MMVRSEELKSSIRMTKLSPLRVPLPALSELGITGEELARLYIVLSDVTRLTIDSKPALKISAPVKNAGKRNVSRNILLRGLSHRFFFGGSPSSR
jgi:hypothetical protein